MASDVAAKGSVYSLRFNATEVELLKSLAEREDMKIVEVIREAIRHMASGRTYSPQAATGWRGKVKFEPHPTPASLSGTRA